MANKPSESASKPRVVLDVNPLKRLVELLSNTVDFVEQTGPLETAIAETKTRLQTARDEESALTATVSTLKEEISKLTSKKADHLARIDAMLADAQAQADQMKADAKKKYTLKMDDATSAANQIIAAAEARAAEVDGATTSAKQNLADTLAAIENAAKERTTLQKAIDGLKAKFI